MCSSVEEGKEMLAIAKKESGFNMNQTLVNFALRLQFCLFINFTKFVILENLCVLHFVLSELKGLKGLYHALFRETMKIEMTPLN